MTKLDSVKVSKTVVRKAQQYKNRREQNKTSAE